METKLLKLGTKLKNWKQNFKLGTEETSEMDQTLRIGEHFEQNFKNWKHIHLYSGRHFLDMQYQTMKGSISSRKTMILYEAFFSTRNRNVSQHYWLFSAFRRGVYRCVWGGGGGWSKGPLSENFLVIARIWRNLRHWRRNNKKIVIGHF